MKQPETQENNPERPPALAEAHGSATCCLCNWTNTNLLNLGEPGAPRWTCHGCCKRMLDALQTIADTGYNNCSHQLMRDTARAVLSPNAGTQRPGTPDGSLATKRESRVR